jgi:hypothetical protein
LHPELGGFEMKIEILRDSITGNYSWVLYDGPENIDKFSGFENTLGEVFEKIITCRVKNALSYVEGTP